MCVKTDERDPATPRSETPGAVSMTPLREQEGGILSRVVGSVLTDRSECYECEFCQLSFDRDRLNCPACGGTIVEA